MKKYTYSLHDWCQGYRLENAPPDELLDTFPIPTPYRPYKPAWGKYSKTAEKAAATRNRKAYDRDKEVFRFEILPQLVDQLDDASLLSIGLALGMPVLISRSGYRYFRKDDRGEFLARDDERLPKALEIGAAPITPEEYFALFPGRHG